MSSEPSGGRSGRVPGGWPEWPVVPPAYGGVVLRAFTDADVPFALALGEDPYVPLIGSLPAHPTEVEALDWIHRQQGRLAAGFGVSFAVADARSGVAVGAANLGLRDLPAGRATGGYAVAPGERGRGVGRDALIALTAYGWTIPALHRIELHVEPWNTGSVRVAEAAGYVREGLLRSHQEIGGTRRDMLLYAAVRP